VIVYEAQRGANCVDELYAIYPDGRITAEEGANRSRSSGPDEIKKLLSHHCSGMVHRHAVFNGARNNAGNASRSS